MISIDKNNQQFFIVFVLFLFIDVLLSRQQNKQDNNKN